MKKVVVAGLGIMAMMLAACADDRAGGSNGGSVTTGATFSGLYVAAGSNAIARVDLAGRASREIQVGGEPTRIARSGDRVYISLRTERKVNVYQDTDQGLQLVGTIATGAEPYGVVATSSRVYVASSVGGFVAEHDASTFEQLRSWSISGEPRWVTMHPNGKALYVGSAYGGVLTHIDLGSGVARQVALPAVQSFNFNDGTPIELAKRITADPMVSPDGAHLYIGMLYLDNVTPIPDAFLETGEPAPGCDGTGDRAPPPPDGSGSTGGMGGVAVPPVGCGGGGGYDNQKFNPAIDVIPVDPATGVPNVDQAEAINITSFINQEDNVGNLIGGQPVSGYPAALATSADGRIVFAAIEGAEAVVAMLAQIPGNTMGAPVPNGARAPSDAAFPGQVKSFSFRNTLTIRTAAAPRGLAVVNGELFVHAFFDQKVEQISVDDVDDVFQYQSGNAAKALEVDIGPNGAVRQLATRDAINVSSEVIDADANRGRRLFYATNNPLMATVGAGVSCATCHFENRTDGVTWHFARGPRQTPNLSVDIQHAQPVGWVGNVPTVADEGMSTSQRLMGGQNLQPSDAESIQAFLFKLRTIDTPNKALAADEKVVRGQAVFANVGCVSCHNGPSFTDNKQYTMLGLNKVKTRPLSGIAASGPYFHDGSAETLREVVDRASRGEMGAPFSISSDDADALVEYLKSL